MVVCLVKKPVVILYDVLVKVKKFIFLDDFVILDRKVDLKVLIILGRPFLSTKRVVVDMKSNEIKFRWNNKKVKLMCVNWWINQET